MGVLDFYLRQHLFGREAFFFVELTKRLVGEHELVEVLVGSKLEVMHLSGEFEGILIPPKGA